MKQKKAEHKQRGERKNGSVHRGSKIFGFRADKEMTDFLNQLDNKTAFIRKSLREQMILAQEERADRAFAALGEVIPAQRVKPLQLPYLRIKVVAGFPIPLDNDELAQDIEVLGMLCPHPEDCYLIRVHGHSMVEAGVSDGDLLIVDKSQRSPTERQIAVCELNGEYTLKRVVKKEGKYWLIPANPEYPEIPVEEEDDFSVWGVVTYIIHKPLC